MTPETLEEVRLELQEEISLEGVAADWTAAAGAAGLDRAVVRAWATELSLATGSEHPGHIAAAIAFGLAIGVRLERTGRA